MRFTITQHSRDEKLLRSLVSYLGCGRYVLRKNKDFGDFIVTKFNDINMKIICFFKKYPIRGVKALDFGDWCNAADIMKNKEHLTVAGFNEIKLIKSKMNSNRQKFIDSNLGKRFMSTTRNVQGCEGVKTKIIKLYLDKSPLDEGYKLGKVVNARNQYSTYGKATNRGSFSVRVRNTGTSYLELKYELTHSTRDEVLMKSLVSYLGCGNTAASSFAAGRPYTKGELKLPESLRERFLKGPLAPSFSFLWVPLAKHPSSQVMKSLENERRSNRILAMTPGASFITVPSRHTPISGFRFYSCCSETDLNRKPQLLNP